MVEIIQLKTGAYFDEEEMLHDEKGNLMPDGIYRTQEGEVFSFEGNRENELKKLLEGLE